MATTDAAVTASEQRLERLEDLLEQWKARVVEAVQAGEVADPIDETFADRLKQTIGRLVEINDQLHPEDFDPEALAEIRDIIIKGLAALEDIGDDRPLDVLNSFMVTAEAIRHLVRDALDAHVTGAGDSTRRVMEDLHRWLPRTTQKQLAELVGKSPKTLQRWAHSAAPPERRLRLVARLVALLRRGWAEEGVIDWFHRPRHDLGGKAPVDLLDAVGEERALLIAARQGRA